MWIEDTSILGQSIAFCANASCNSTGPCQDYVAYRLISVSTLLGNTYLS